MLHLNESRRRLRSGYYFGDELPSLMTVSVIVNMLEDQEECVYQYVRKKVLLKEYNVLEHDYEQYRDDNQYYTIFPKCITAKEEGSINIVYHVNSPAVGKAVVGNCCFHDTAGPISTAR